MYTSQLQFGFKAKHGCRDAISVLYNTVEYYTLNGSTVNIVRIDLSKALDKVNLYGLAIKLMNRDVPKVLVSVVLDWYRNIFVRVRWNEIRAMIALVCEELRWIDMVINVKKSAMIRIGPRFKA